MPLYNHSENGVEIQFYLLMTLAILLLKFKQDREATEKQKSAEGKEKAENKGQSAGEWIKSIGEIFYESWKISKKWLLVVKNSIGKVVDNELLMLLNSS